MRVLRDGSVFRIELETPTGEFETRISFAVNCHDKMGRPRLEMCLSALLRLFMELLQHITGQALVEEFSNWDLSYRNPAYDHLMRIVREVAVAARATDLFGRACTSESALASMRALIVAPKPPKEREDWEQMTEDVQALLARLQQKPAELRKDRDYGTYGLGPDALSVLRGYERGDLTLKEAEDLLKQWKDRK